ncbi:MAG TPA: class I SAM-dependent methyltransferase [Thermoanaerobaculia bacterium]|nr:class I SAM-dependent methyltransferase [Thermoanaerobaculia bacterium]
MADAAGESPLVLVHADPEAYLVAPAAARLIAGLAARPDLDLVLPGTNEPWCEAARVAPPFAYSTPTLLEEAAAAVANAAAGPAPVEAPASPVYAIRRAALERAARGDPLERLPERLRPLSAAVDRGAYLHRYGAMDASPRADLAALVPEGARAVLDVGCSRGATAAALRARGVAFLAGIEPDAEDAAAAAAVYDEVRAVALESSGAGFGRTFDAVLFGDVLEHLEDPSDALVRVRAWLAPSGVVVASVPNVGHWSVIDDLIRGRFDYVPYSLLSGTHVRFFTRRTLVDLFEASGYRVRQIDVVRSPAPPGRAASRDRLRALPGSSDDLDVAEFLAVAEAAS